MDGNVKIGYIANVNPKAFTCDIISADGLNTYTDCALPGNYDPLGGAHSINLPSNGCPCMYTQVNHTAYVMQTFFPRNLSPEDDIGDATESRKPSGFTTDGVQPGESVGSNGTGGHESMGGSGKEIVLNDDKLYTKWNTDNFMLKEVCNRYSLEANGLSITAGGGQGGSCDTIIKAGKGAGGSDVVISMGASSNVLEIIAAGAQITHVDGAQNVTHKGNNVNCDYDSALTVNAKTLRICGLESIELVAPTIKISAANLEMQSENTTMIGSEMDVNYTNVNVADSDAVALP